ncbi:trihelix transcription factor gt-3b [Phtheirospermum japonicum]|uniref:Trihelix transcription factor gt-3b n=1 Tax=Phtheirospermum japonicum TaxID=374723 RepID=A0A830CJY6_9LAMI|nr:trihelix transcription factor gt-3b [Phtheirospermum japonicum]
MIPFSPSPSLLSFSASASGGGGGSGGADDDDDFPRRDERFPQWSNQETRDFIEIRAQFELEFTTAKRDKNLWEVVANRMRDKGYRRTPDQCKCKWNNLVSRYKGQETADVDNSRPCPFFNELHAVFTARANRMQSPQPNADTFITKSRNTLTNASEDQSHEDFSHEQDDDGEEKKPARKKRQKTVETENCKNSSAVNSLGEIMMNFMAQQQMIDARWRESMERRAEERDIFEDEWRRKMESLERERAAMEKARRERDEQRWLRDESRAEKRDALLTMLLNKLVRDEI